MNFPETMMGRSRRNLCFLTLATCSAGTASAADSGFYLGADLGWVPKYAQVHEQGPIILDNVDGSHGGATWGLCAGYRIDRHIGVELGYVDLGRQSTAVAAPASPTSSFGNAVYSARGEALSVIGSLPLGLWDLSLRGGILHADTHFSFDGVLGGIPVADRFTVLKTYALVGGAIGYSLTDHLHLQLAVTRYMDVGSASLAHGERLVGPSLGTFTLGLSWQL
jgi:hypothetical protein